MILVIGERQLLAVGLDGICMKILVASIIHLALGYSIQKVIVINSFIASREGQMGIFKLKK